MQESGFYFDNCLNLYKEGETNPKFVRAFAENQPMTSIVNAIRALLYDGNVGNEIWVALTTLLLELLNAR